VDAAKAQASSVDLDIAWQEWQVAQSAKAAAYKVLSLQDQLVVARQADKLLREDQQTVQKALNLQLKTSVDLSAAQAGWQEAHSTVLELEGDLAKQRLALERLLGRNGQAPTPLRKQAFVGAKPPQAAELSAGLEDRRLDLLALRRGYDSQEATVRAAVLARFPKTTAGASLARDTAGSATFGYSVAMDVPIFDSNQGNIAIERATRQKLFDEFVNRVFEGRNDIASGVAQIESLQRQVAFAQSAVPILERLVSDYGKALNAGSADVISYYSAYNDLDKKRIEVLKLRQELIDAWISLENASGMYLTGSTATSMPAGSMPASHPTGQGAAK
jgi:outer membrane protein, heavy metal efflux system